MSEASVVESNIEDIIEKEGVYASVTVGSSMRPLFKTHRDMIVLRKKDVMLNKYDVALYRISGKYILHRVIGIDKARGVYIIRGDNTYKKEYIPFGKIIAVLVSFNRKGKHYDVSDKKYRVYSVIWCAIYPIRYVSWIAWRATRKILRMLFKKKSEVS